jgi:hypothetical protein
MENELLGPRSGTSGNAPPWWKLGARVKRRFDGQAGIAGFSAEGEPMVLVGRGIMGTLRMEIDTADWEADDEKLILTPLQIAKVSYEADRAVRMSLGVPGVPEWGALHEQDRLQWMWGAMKNESLSGDHAHSRTNLVRAIVSVLREEIK